MTSAEPGHEQQTVHTDRKLVAGRYRLHARIGRGRIGEIYEADDEGYRDVGVGRCVAIQLLPDRVTLNDALFSKLKLGYAVVRAASHPNIVPYLDIDHDGKFGYLVMDFLDGASLRSILDGSTTLPLDEVSPVIRAVGDALQFLHAKSIVHGRLTAENIFITEDLEVRLLDVVPLDSASTTLRGVASSDPFSRCDIDDDVYGLGCLAYEMLTGKHPFNFHTLADARHAGTELTRINSVPEKQWNALCRVLSFDREQRTPTIADFLHEFGITGTERLQPPHESTMERDSDNQIDPPIGPIAIPDIARAKRRRAKRMPSPILIVALVGLGIWFVYGQPSNDLVTVSDYVDSYLDGRSTEAGGGRLPIKVSDPTPAQTAAEVTTGAETTGAETTGAETIVATDEAATLPADEPLADSGTDASRSESEFTLIQSFVTISESDGAARINTRRPRDTASRVFWWTGDHTAIANSDYIPIELPVEGFTSGEEFESLHISLINDSLPETRESFFVYLGRHNAELGRLEPILRVQVDISDDD